MQHAAKLSSAHSPPNLDTPRKVGSLLSLRWRCFRLFRYPTNNRRVY